MTRKKAHLTALLAAMMMTTGALAQERVMSLEAVMAAADTGSTSLKAARAATAAAHEQATAADRTAMLPDVKLSASAGYLGNGYGWGRDSSYSFSVSIPHFGTRFAAEAAQVVYAGGAMQSVRRQAQLGARVAELACEQQRQQLRMQLAGLYLDLLRSACQLAVFDSNIAHTDRMIADIGARHEQGTALRNDLTRYELQRARLEMQRTATQNDMRIANSRLVTMAGLPQGTVVVADSAVLSMVPKMDGNSTPIPVQTAGTMADMAREKQRQSRAGMLPQVALVAQDELNGPVTIDITPYNINYNYWFVGVALNYNLSSLWKQNRALRAARQEQAQRDLELQAATEQANEELKAATLRLQEAQENYSVKQKSVELAERNYTLVSNRYQNELAPLADMLDASNSKLAAELDLIGARIGIVFQILTLQYINGQL